MSQLKNNDPLGQALIDEWNGVRKEKLWTDAPNFAPEEFPISYLMRSYRDMPALEKELLQKASGRVLDVGAAAGSHSLYLQEQGLDVTALEMSPLACELMQRRGINSIERRDLWSYEPDELFDSVLLIMNGLGLAGTLDQLPKFLDKVRSWLRPKGQILFDSSDVSYLYDPGYFPEDRYFGEFRYRFRYGGLLSTTFPWVFVDPESLKEVLNKVGGEWTEELKGDHYDYGGVIRFRE